MKTNPNDKTRSKANAHDEQSAADTNPQTFKVIRKFHDYLWVEIPVTSTSKEEAESDASEFEERDVADYPRDFRVVWADPVHFRAYTHRCRQRLIALVEEICKALASEVQFDFMDAPKMWRSSLKYDYLETFVIRWLAFLTNTSEWEVFENLNHLQIVDPDPELTERAARLAREHGCVPPTDE